MRPLNVYACYNKSTESRMVSSSGAIFSLLAEYVLSKDGIVYGVGMSEDCYSAEFVRVSQKTELAKLRGSKYLQAKVGMTFRRVRTDLSDGRLVLFSGTGCQVNGLRNFLGKKQDNLICIDIICHGVPSPALWRKYVEYLEEKEGGKLKYINFRSKDNTWEDFRVKKLVGTQSPRKIKRLYISKSADAYMQMFLRDYCLRPSCYACQAKEVKQSDLTIADFWGIDKVAPEMNDGRGVSLVLIRNEMGQKILEVISDKVKMREVTYEEGVAANPSEYLSVTKPRQRDVFFQDMGNKKFDELEKQYVPPIKVSLKNKVKRKIRNIIKQASKSNEKMQIMDYSLYFVFECERK